MPTTTKTLRSGRRPGPVSSRSDVLSAATRIFAREGYGSTTIRAIATEAGVDSALVVRFFGGKEQLFEAVLQSLDEGVPDVQLLAHGAAGDRGRRLAQAYFTLWESPATAEAAQALVRGAVGTPSASKILQQFLKTRLFTGVPEPAIAAAMATLLGVAVIRYVVRVGPLMAVTLDELVDLIAPQLQLQLEQLSSSD